MADLLPALRDGGARRALTFPDRQLTYAELERESAAVAEELRGLGRAAVIAEPTWQTAVAVVGALRAGVPIVPINPRSGASELDHLAADARPEALLARAGQPVARALAGVRVIAVGAAPGSSPPTGPGPGPGPGPSVGLGLGLGLGPTGEEPALVVYTSGTTGPPKGVVLPARAIAANLDALAQAWSWTEHDVVAHALPLFHVHGLVVGVLGPLRRGGEVVHLGRFSPEAVRDVLAGRATMLFGVPTMYRRLADAAEAEADGVLARALGRARLLVSGSAALPTAEHARLRELTGRGVVERYGMTETLMNTAVRAGAPAEVGTVGEALPGVEIRLVDDDGGEVGTGDGATIGEVQVRGPNVFLGYLGRPQATAEVLTADGWFTTGDMAVWAPRGALRLVGRRATDLIKSGGHRIGAGEIEEALREHPAVADVAVTGEPDDDLGERVVAWVVLRSGAAADERELSDHVTRLLAPHKRPRTVRFLAELPRNELGKVQKRRLTVPRRGEPATGLESSG